MSDDFSLINIARYILAYATIAIIFILELTSFSVPLSQEIRPFFALIIIYYWSIYRPELLPAIVIGLAGIIFDIVLHYPIGLHAIIFLVAQWIIKSQSSFFTGQNYVIVWLGFLTTCASVLLIEYTFFCAYAGTFIEIVPVISTAALTTLFFPLITFIFVLIHHILPPASKSWMS